MGIFISIMCAGFYILCNLYENNKSFILRDENIDVIYLLTNIVGYSIVFYFIYYMFKNKGLSKTNEIFIRFYDELAKKPFWISCIIIGALWLPYFVAYSPGTAMWDTFVTLNNMYAPVKTAHHPIFINFIMQGCIKLGRILFNEDFVGMYIYVIVQYVFCLCSIGYLISYLVHYIQKKWIVITTILFFSLLTVWPSYAMTMVKDTGFYALFLLFNVALVKLCKNINDNKKIDKYIFVTSGIGLILFRNNGIYVTLFLLVFLIVVCILKNNFIDINIFKKLILYLCLIFVIGSSINYLLMDTMGYLRGGRQEMLSIPFQQTARVVNKYPAKILPEERDTINLVLNYNKIGKEYVPRKSDPVKWYYRFRIVETEQEAVIEKEALISYFDVWCQMFLKYPVTYIEATFANVYGYFYIPYIGYEDGWFFTSANKKINDGRFKLNHFRSTKQLRNKIYKLRCELKKFVLTKYFYSCGLYTTILFICFCILLKGQRIKTLLMFMPVIVIVLTCIASPVNAYIRYYLPVMAVTPLFIGEALIKE